MNLIGLHLLLTYKCTLECSHCFVWGSPWQEGTMTIQQIRHILQEARDLGTVKWIYFEGGEPFLYYAHLFKAVQEASANEFQVGIVSNSYWATSVEDAFEYLEPLKCLIQDLSISSDLFHWSEEQIQLTDNARKAAEALNIPLGFISIAQPEVEDLKSGVGTLPKGESAVMYRGRAAEKLSGMVEKHDWEEFNTCPYEDLRDPGRLHVDPLGNLHICQGISLGNIFESPLKEIIASYHPDNHPITGPILEGGPAALVTRYNLPHQEAYADACHLCDEACRLLRTRYPDILLPDQMYGIF